MSVAILNPLDRIIFKIAERFGARSKEVERFLKFAIVGTLGAIVDFTTVNVLQFTVLVPVEPNLRQKVILAAGIAFCTAVASNFFWNRYWTYPDSRSRSLRRQLVIFFLLNAVGLGFRITFVPLTYSALGEAGTTFLENMGVLSPDNHVAMVNQIGTNIALALAMVVVMFWNFFSNRYWTYNDVDQNPGQQIAL